MMYTIRSSDLAKDLHVEGALPSIGHEMVIPPELVAEWARKGNFSHSLIVESIVHEIDPPSNFDGTSISQVYVVARLKPANHEARNSALALELGATLPEEVEAS